jgi:hypothetical protein
VGHGPDHLPGEGNVAWVSYTDPAAAARAWKAGVSTESDNHESAATSETSSMVNLTCTAASTRGPCLPPALAAAGKPVLRRIQSVAVATPTVDERASSRTTCTCKASRPSSRTYPTLRRLRDHPLVHEPPLVESLSLSTPGNLIPAMAHRGEVDDAGPTRGAEAGRADVARHHRGPRTPRGARSRACRSCRRRSCCCASRIRRGCGRRRLSLISPD